mgnify:CR=1 FL=1
MKIYYFFTLLLLSAICQAQDVDIPDANFKDALVNTACVDTDGDGSPDSDADTNDDGEIQESEAEAVLWLDVGSKNISSLEGIQSFTNLEVLLCGFNELTSLDVTQNTNLEILSCRNNQLTSLDVQNTNLEVLQCFRNQLSSLDVTQNTNLELLWCWNNELTSLDVTQNTNLEDLGCGGNQLTSLNIKNGNNHNMSTMMSWGNPNLTCIQVDDETAIYPTCTNGTGWCKDSIAIYREDCSLAVEDFNKLSFTLYPNPTQDVLNIDSQNPIDSVRIYSLNGSLIKETKPLY